MGISTSKAVSMIASTLKALSIGIQHTTVLIVARILKAGSIVTRTLEAVH